MSSRWTRLDNSPTMREATKQIAAEAAANRRSARKAAAKTQAAVDATFNTGWITVTRGPVTEGIWWPKGKTPRAVDLEAHEDIWSRQTFAHKVGQEVDKRQDARRSGDLATCSDGVLLEHEGKAVYATPIVKGKRANHGGGYLARQVEVVEEADEDLILDVLEPGRVVKHLEAAFRYLYRLEK